MDKQELIEREIKALDTLSKEYIHHIEDVLSSIRNEPVKLWLQKQDQYRLLTLRAWESKYKVNTRDILQILLPFWEYLIKRRSRKIKKAGLNVRVTTLIGKKSEQVLIEGIKQRFPNRENVLLFTSSHRERIIQTYLKKLKKQTDDGVRSHSDPSSMYGTSGKVLTLLDFSTPAAFMKYYRKYMQKESLAREQVETEMKKRAYRNNPFRPEFL
jgi:hypothetical protein